MDVFLDSKISNAVNVCPKTITVTNVVNDLNFFMNFNRKKHRLPCITLPETKVHVSAKINN